jgi:NTE family protein
LTDVGGVALTAMINNYTFESMALLRHLAKEWSNLRQAEHPDRPPLEYYVMEVTFHALSDVKERQGFLDVATSFNLSDAQVDRLRHVGQRILFDSADFKRLVRDLGGNVSESVNTPAVASP